ncbi:MAG: septum formation protein Maf [Planctomycetes bacterium]|nr:septum formation protein Maf [Planctomycetota bacterium]
MPTAHTTLVLASASPRRREILARLGAPFEVIPAEGVDEEAVRGAPEHVARTLAGLKAEAVLARLGATRGGEAGRWVVLGADTVVALGEGSCETILGKPRDGEDARRMLSLLQGRAHRVVTGVAVAERGKAVRVDSESTEVAFRPLSPEDIDRYVATGDPEGKAGAYGIQSGAAGLVAEIRGCYYNVVGLPLVLAAGLLAGTVPAAACDCARHPRQRGGSGCGRRFALSEALRP